MSALAQRSLNRVLKAIYTNKLGPNQNSGAYESSSCVYKYDSGNNCAVGAMLNKSTIKWLMSRGLNEDTTAEDLSSHMINYLTHDLTAETGIDMCDMQELQELHDEWVVFDKEPEELNRLYYFTQLLKIGIYAHKE